jgi:ubiquitin C-terminal hydrolase
MHNELNRIVKKPKYKQIDCDNNPMIEQSEIWYRYFRDRDNSIITDLFEGQLMSKIECEKCGHKSLTFDNFMDLSIQIPKSSSSVGDCLENFISAERMEKCGYKCSKCKAIDRMDKQITIFRFPKILVIHLKRFSRREKITSSITIPSKLDMTPYAPHSSK